MSQQRFFASLTHQPHHHAYNRPSRLSITFTGEGRTKQSFKAECDINNILKRFGSTGILPEPNKDRARFLDATGYDYQEAMQTIAQARSLFEELPAETRYRFENDPAKLLDFVHDPANVDESVALGLLDADRLPESLRKPPTPAQGATPSPGASQAPSQAVSAPSTPPSAGQGGKGA